MKEIVDELDIIASRDGKKKSQIIISLIAEYVKAHSAGNSTFKLENWVDNPTFTAIPTIHADTQHWNNHFKECKTSERVELLKKLNTLRSLAIRSGPLK